jgi:CheY-like chemotaxis protein
VEVDMGHIADAQNRDILQDHKIIVAVEDNELVAETIKEILETEADAGYTVVAVNNGEEALPVIKSIPVSLILLDVKLPGMNGFEIYDALKADPSAEHIPVIFIPATYFEDEFKARGINDPLLKPFKPDQLISRVAQACHSHPSKQ